MIVQMHTYYYYRIVHASKYLFLWSVIKSATYSHALPVYSLSFFLETLIQLGPSRLISPKWVQPAQKWQKVLGNEGKTIKSMIKKLLQ